MKKYFILCLICLLTLCGCGEVPKLKNGEEAAITFKKGKKEHKISANDLYTELKTNFGLEATIRLIDEYILDTEFKDYISEAEEQAKNYVDSMIESYGDEATLLQQIKQYTNYSSIDAYREYLTLSYKQSHATEEYAKMQITDEEINDYYKDKVYGDVELYHILITPKVTDDMSDEEKTNAEKEAKDKIKDIIKQLDESEDVLEDFKKLAKENSEDEATKDKDGKLGYVNYGDLGDNYDELLDAAFKLENKEYSKSVITTELGYHVIYRSNSKKKEKLKDVKDTIVEKLAKEYLEKEPKASINALEYYRDLYNLKIIDSELDKQYGIYLNNLINASASNEQNQ